MHIKTQRINEKWKLFELKNDNGMTVSVLDYGGIITGITVPDKNGNRENVVLGYKNIHDYQTDSCFFGAVIGRVAGRIQDASFTLEGTNYTLETNDGDNHLHGGINGFHQAIWHSLPFHTKETIGIKLSHTSADGEGGYPGNVEVSVTYTLNNQNQLTIDYKGETDKTTALAMTNHTYFNLTGDLKETVHNHHVTIDSQHVVELDSSLIPTGKKLEVSNTPFDFRYGRNLTEGINSNFDQNLTAINGYDHYFIFDQNKKENIVVKEPQSGRVLKIETDHPGMVMYTSNSLSEGLKLAEGHSKKYQGVCFETQSSPASLHHEGFPSVVVNAGETYKRKTVFTFGVE